MADQDITQIAYYLDVYEAAMRKADEMLRLLSDAELEDLERQIGDTVWDTNWVSEAIWDERRERIRIEARRVAKGATNG